MLQITPKQKVFLGVPPIDFRKGMDGMAAICRQHWQLNPQDGHFFVFRNRKGNALKILAYDTQGYWLIHKRLSAGTFRYWPTAGQAVITLTPVQLQVLLYNGDPQGVHMAPPWRPSTD
jgi:transposase